MEVSENSERESNAWKTSPIKWGMIRMKPWPNSPSKMGNMREKYSRKRDTNAEDKGGMSVSSVTRQHKERRFVLQELVSDAASRLTTASQFEGSYYITSVRIFYYACYTTSKIYWNERHSKEILVYFLDCKGLKFILFIPIVFLQSSSEMVLQIINLFGCQVCKLHKISKGREYWLEFLPFY